MARRRMDALLGREALVDLSLGAVLAGVRAENPLLASSFGWEAAPGSPSHLLNGGATRVLAAAVHEFSDALLFAMVFLFVAAMSRLLLRRA